MITVTYTTETIAAGLSHPVTILIRTWRLFGLAVWQSVERID